MKVTLLDLDSFLSVSEFSKPFMICIISPKNCTLPINSIYPTQYYACRTFRPCTTTLSHMRYIPCHFIQSQMLLQMMYYQKHRLFLCWVSTSFLMIRIIKTSCATSVQTGIHFSKNGGTLAHKQYLLNNKPYLNDYPNI